ncbi:MAG TPA: large conductance mechanosensitive channel protein MscL [Candidatus Limnocylindrales bacterium]|nr:large conductance mechanosensitive channel protein MscL [Candidatus Limnocylindrales bacterium]
MWPEFKAFLLKTNALALAIAFILGLALASVVNSLVADIIMPPVGLALGGVDFQNLFIDLSGKHYATLAAAKEAGAATINYGVFLMSVITFIVVAFVVFLIARSLIKPAPIKACPRCTSEIPIAATRCPFCTSELTTARA